MKGYLYDEDGNYSAVAPRRFVDRYEIVKQMNMVSQ